MNRIMDIIMLVIMVPTVLILFFYEYPKKWIEKNYIFGVWNRAEFKEKNASEKIDEITFSCRKQAMIIVILSLIFMAAICFIPDFTTRMIIWTAFVLLDIILLNIPLMRGNGEMKSLKTELGIASKKGVTYTDLKSVDSVHSLKISRVIIPTVLAVVFFIVAVLSDLGVVKLNDIFGNSAAYNRHLMVGMTGSLLLVGLMLVPIAIMMDRFRNQVISEDSDINMNYNRAKKKNMADLSVLFIWINTVSIILMMVVMSIWDEEILFLAMFALYMLVLMIGLAVFCTRNIAIERRYRKDTTIEMDDDDNWVLGQFYYNPDDKRLNVEKRIGVGATINMAHPVGKAISIVLGLVIIGMFIMLIYVGILSKTPMSIRIENDSLVCHQMKDDYVIPIKSMDEPMIGLESGDLKLHKESGYDMDPMYKGRYNVNGFEDCTVFINYESSHYITFYYDGSTYFRTGGTDEETVEVFDQLYAIWKD